MSKINGGHHEEATPTAQAVSAAAHARLPHANPLTVEQMSDLVTKALARAPQTALEIGCGPGTFCTELARRGPVQVTALDPNASFLARAKERAASHPLQGTVTFYEQEAATYKGPSVDLVVCIGASQAFGQPREAVRKATRLLVPGGTLIFADIVWSAAPPAEFLGFLGVAQDLYWLRTEAEAVFAAAGLTIEAELQASADSPTADWAARVSVSRPMSPEADFGELIERIHRRLRRAVLSQARKGEPSALLRRLPFRISAISAAALWPPQRPAVRPTHPPTGSSP